MDLEKYLSNTMLVATMIWQTDMDIKLYFPNYMDCSIEAVLSPSEPRLSFHNGTTILPVAFRWQKYLA